MEVVDAAAAEALPVLGGCDIALLFEGQVLQPLHGAQVGHRGPQEHLQQGVIIGFDMYIVYNYYNHYDYYDIML